MLKQPRRMAKSVGRRASVFRVKNVRRYFSRKMEDKTGANTFVLSALSFVDPIGVGRLPKGEKRR